MEIKSESLCQIVVQTKDFRHRKPLRLLAFPPSHLPGSGFRSYRHP